MTTTRLLLFFIALTMVFLGCGKEDHTKLTVAAAANMQFAMEELTRAFLEDTDIECETIISSSGKLTAQIKEGAPFDIFVSADMKYPNDLFENGFTTGEPDIYGYGKLVLWSMYEGVAPTIDLLTSEKISHIALANPKIAPYGVAAREVLKHHGIWERVQDKLVYGESIAQTNQFITSKAAEMGFTAKSVVLSPALNSKGRWRELNPDTYTPIAQGIVLLKGRESQQAKAQKFRDFLFSAKGKKILNKFGYSTSNERSL